MRTFIVIADKAIEQAHAEGGRALGHRRCVFFRPGDAGDIEMRPGHLVDEALHELRADDAARGAVAGDVLDVGGVAVDRLVVGIVERQAPQFLADRLASRDEALRQLIIVA